MDTAADSRIIDELNSRLLAEQVENSRLRAGANNPDVVQLSKIYVDETIDMANRQPAAFRLLMILIRQMNQTNNVMISTESLEKITKLSNSTVKRAIKFLREESWIEVWKVGPSNLYRINSDAFPTDPWASAMTNVILNRDEQDEQTKARLPNTFTRHIPLVTNAYGDSNRHSTIQRELDL